MQVHLYRVTDEEYEDFYIFIGEESYTYVRVEALDDKHYFECNTRLEESKKRFPESAFYLEDIRVELIELDIEFNDAWQLAKMHNLLE
ncbi:hypothetical protein PYDG_00009 [Pseudoalteromonas phage pYD6-A]|uniref:Uncharacterized protein n=1 Tax=Pseudoalteromonas phage pYD6-A TaxID=754052 RepID=M4SRW3_9CAUD|nr:hypothetical protein PYDG_00009 [Pseudoalteromonas phage pYD6-A]AGH57541.1 hypothetical protein PYDG_00009 [Pseudoalteromonas phage pYD6-A]